MGLRKADYYIKLILNSTLEDLIDLQDQIENDMTLSAEELEFLERSINDLMKEKSHLDLKLINKNTGKEEIADLSLDRPFHGTAMFQGEVLMYGIKWEVYTPAPLYLHLGIRKWNYNSGVSDILTNCIIKATPGNFMHYFHYPPWLLGTSYAPHTHYMSLNEIITRAISTHIIPDWDYLALKGIPRLFIEDIRENSMGTAK
ncbi:MAG: hypothetical protein ACYCUZ_07265 [Cuniculiplasma sp.]